MQAKYYALTAMVSAAVAMSAQAQTPTEVNTPTPTETQSGQVPDTQPSTVIIVDKAAPGVTHPATREEVRAETRAAMKAGSIARGEQSTPFMKPASSGSEYLWER